MSSGDAHTAGMDAWLRALYRRWPGGFSNALFALMAVVWAAGTVGAATRGWSWPVVVLFSAGLLAVLFIAADELMTLLARPQRMTDAELRRAVADWLRRQGYGVDEQAVDGAAFRFVAEASGGQQPLAVSKVAAEPGVLVIGTGLAIPAGLRDAFGRLPAQDRAEAIDDMRLEMARLGVAYRGIGAPLTEIYVEYALLANESLTEQAFFQGVRRVVTASAVLRQHLNRTFRRAQGSTAGEVEALVQAVAVSLDGERGEPTPLRDPSLRSG